VWTCRSGDDNTDYEKPWAVFEVVPASEPVCVAADTVPNAALAESPADSANGSECDCDADAGEQVCYDDGTGGAIQVCRSGSIVPSECAFECCWMRWSLDSCEVEGEEPVVPEDAECTPDDVSDCPNPQSSYCEDFKCTACTEHYQYSTSKLAYNCDSDGTCESSSSCPSPSSALADCIAEKGFAYECI
jgi:hypothetical protein